MIQLIVIDQLWHLVRYPSTDWEKPKAMRQRHSFVCSVFPRTVCLRLDGQGRSAHFGVNLVEPPGLPQWRRRDESPGLS